MGKAGVRLRVAARVLAATLGAYGVTAGGAALGAVLLVATAQQSRSDAVVAAGMASYLLYTFLMLWSFAERRLGLVWLVLLLGTLATHGLAVAIERTLPISGAGS
ncbi:hypothetical protein GRI97_17255 [Altererythrobacter xixiisoli]|uniref:Iron transporter n=1 Tax=Croceibacterium xixiisoli TaxID=1476466 RepID=A0A6I4TZI9_9SPHN|nr:hypothetical protein [Croceibacterium xixiisoli]MXP00741.1 hypothetical protein [Croceibacterium xixiisoli]